MGVTIVLRCLLAPNDAVDGIIKETEVDEELASKIHPQAPQDPPPGPVGPRAPGPVVLAMYVHKSTHVCLCVCYQNVFW